ncbi:MAG: peptide ABC transporter permease, partial [Meiothermus sp.]
MRRTRVFRHLLSHRLAVVGIGILLGMVLMALLAPLLSPYSPTQTDFAALQ